MITVYRIDNFRIPDEHGNLTMEEIETAFFHDEQDAYDWADDMGYLTHDDYVCVWEDNFGTRTTLR